MFDAYTYSPEFYDEYDTDYIYGAASYSDRKCNSGLDTYTGASTSDGMDDWSFTR